MNILRCSIVFVGIQNRVGEKMINHIINWIVNNQEWVFSGIGVTILLGVITLFRKIFGKKAESERNIKIEQKNEGHNNTQIGIQNNNYYGGSENAR